LIIKQTHTTKGFGERIGFLGYFMKIFLTFSVGPKEIFEIFFQKLIVIFGRGPTMRIIHMFKSQNFGTYMESLS